MSSPYTNVCYLKLVFLQLSPLYSWRLLFYINSCPSLCQQQLITPLSPCSPLETPLHVRKQAMLSSFRSPRSSCSKKPNQTRPSKSHKHNKEDAFLKFPKNGRNRSWSCRNDLGYRYFFLCKTEIPFRIAFACMELYYTVV
jgi:hypothetical protein